MAADRSVQEKERCVGYVVKVEPLLKKEPVVEGVRVLAPREIDDLPQGCVFSFKPRVQIDVILELAAPADRAGFRRQDLFDREKRDLLFVPKGQERRKGAVEASGLNAVDGYGQLIGVAHDQLSPVGREHRLHNAEESGGDRIVGEQIEIDRYPVLDLERERRAAGEIEVGAEAVELRQLLPRFLSEQVRLDSYANRSRARRPDRSRMLLRPSAAIAARRASRP